MTNNSPLADLVGGYFHQDVFDVYPDEFAAVDNFVKSAPDLAAGLLSDIADLLANETTEDGLRGHLETLGIAIEPGDLTYREWLTQIADRVRAATA
jgi:hypothetical protein